MKKLKTLDKVLIMLGIFLFVFITASVVIYTYNKWPYDTLITMVLGGSGIECLATACISISKIINQNKGKKEEEVDVIGMDFR